MKFGVQSTQYSEVIAAYESAFGFDKPLLEQYITFWKELFRGNMGPSLLGFPTPVVELLRRRIPWTIGLLSLSTLIAWVLGILIGALVGWKRGTRFDKIVSVLSIGISQIPYYIVSVLAVLIVGYYLGWLPVSGAFTPGLTINWLNIAFVADVIRHGILPAFSIVLASTFGWVMSQRSLLITILGEDYLTFAEAKGLKKRRIFTTYAMRNSLLPQVTALGISIGFVMSGSIMVEGAFMYPGVGRLFTEAYNILDYNTIMGFFVLSIFTVLTANLLVGLSLPLIDPRVRVGS
jgi:peptide/nickel transport system permease protein